MIRGLHNIEIAVPDPEALRQRLSALIGNALPLRLVSGDGAPVADRLRIAGPTHLCIQHRDIERLTTALATGGWRAVAPPTDLGGAIRYQYAEDDDGLIVEAESVPDAPAAGAPVLAHVAIATPDRDRLCDWYATLLGTPPRRSARLGPNARIDRLTGMTDVEVSGAWLPAGSMELEFWTYHTPPVVAGPPGPLRALVFASDDLVGDAARLGFTLTGDSATGRDPDGNPVGLVAA